VFSLISAGAWLKLVAILLEKTRGKRDRQS